MGAVKDVVYVVALGLTSSEITAIHELFKHVRIGGTGGDDGEVWGGLTQDTNSDCNKGLGNVGSGVDFKYGKSFCTLLSSFLWGSQGHYYIHVDFQSPPTQLEGSGEDERPDAN